MKKILAAFAVLGTILFSCKKDDNKPAPTAPVVTTAALTNISFNAATGGGSIVSDGGASVTASGIVWSKTNATPTTADSVVAGTTATGTFTSDLTGLEENSSYYIRAFATNSVGTGYGNVVTLNTTNDTNKVRFTYNGEEVVYGIIVSPTTGRKWLDRNLGAKRVATAYDDYEAYGDLFQWGRNDDGHQLMNWTASNAGAAVNGTIGGTEGTVATSDAPGHSDFIIPPYDYPLDWRSDNNSNRWVTTLQGPCPAGWHVPSIEEWLAEVSQTVGGTASSGGFTGRSSAYSQLKITTAGARIIDGPGSSFLGQAGSSGYYWTTTDEHTPEFTSAIFLNIGEDASYGWPHFMSSAMSIRCVKD